MEELLESYLEFLKDVKHITDNTELSYRRDLEKLCIYMEQVGVDDVRQINETLLNSYILYLEKRGFANASISRNIAVIRGYFEYLFRNRVMESDVAENLISPKVPAKPAKKLKTIQAEEVINFPKGTTPKALRDCAMLKLLYVTGIQVSSLIALKKEDVNIKYGFVVCIRNGIEKTYPLNDDVELAIEEYLNGGRDEIVKDSEEILMFTNMSGKMMSRQGFWKMMKGYLKTNGADEEITLSMLRHSFHWYDQ